MKNTFTSEELDQIAEWADIEIATFAVFAAKDPRASEDYVNIAKSISVKAKSLPPTN